MVTIAAPDSTTTADRLALPVLQRIHEDVTALKALSRAPTDAGRYQDVRAVIHAHSYLSHDSRGTPAEIIAGAKKADVRVIFMTDHYTEDRRFLREALRGEKDGILFIPGSELSQGLLTFRMERATWPPGATDAAVLTALKAAGGCGFVAHPEKRTDWDLPFAGMEIYNTHADAEASRADGIIPTGEGSDAIARWLVLLQAARQYPAELFAAIFHVPAANLATWDRLNRTRRVVGIAGNDSHQNVGVSVRGGEGGRLDVVDALGKTIAQPRTRDLPLLLLGVDPAPGQEILKVQLDPYDISFGYVSTHLMVRSITEKECFDALLHGRCYIAFDWLSDPTGFRFFGGSPRQPVEMGEEIGSRDLTLIVETPIPADLRLLRDGREIARGTGTRLEQAVHEPGVYRAEAWLTVGGEPRPWIYSNPIDMRER